MLKGWILITLSDIKRKLIRDWSVPLKRPTYLRTGNWRVWSSKLWGNNLLLELSNFEVKTVNASADFCKVASSSLVSLGSSSNVTKTNGRLKFQFYHLCHVLSSANFSFLKFKIFESSQKLQNFLDNIWTFSHLKNLFSELKNAIIAKFN